MPPRKRNKPDADCADDAEAPPYKKAKTASSKKDHDVHDSSGRPWFDPHFDPASAQFKALSASESSVEAIHYAVKRQLPSCLVLIHTTVASTSKDLYVTVGSNARRFLSNAGSRRLKQILSMLLDERQLSVAIVQKNGRITVSTPGVVVEDLMNDEDEDDGKPSDASSWTAGLRRSCIAIFPNKDSLAQGQWVHFTPVTGDIVEGSGIISVATLPAAHEWILPASYRERKPFSADGEVFDSLEKAKIRITFVRAPVPELETQDAHHLLEQYGRILGREWSMQNMRAAAASNPDPLASIAMSHQVLRDLAIMPVAGSAPRSSLLGQLQMHCITIDGRNLLRQTLQAPSSRRADILERQQIARPLAESEVARDKLKPLILALSKLRPMAYRAATRGITDEEFHPDIYAIIKNAVRVSAETVDILTGHLQSVVRDLAGTLRYWQGVINAAIKVTGSDWEPAHPLQELEASIVVVDQARVALTTAETAAQRSFGSRCHTQVVPDATVHDVTRTARLVIAQTRNSRPPPDQIGWTSAPGPTEYPAFRYAPLDAAHAAYCAAIDQRNSIRASYLNSAVKQPVFVVSLPEWVRIGRTVDELDLCRCFGQWAAKLPMAFCFPNLCNGETLLPRISMSEAAHPFTKPMSSSEDVFRTSDVELDASRHSTMILTGPNAGGKSTLMRTVGLVFVLGQIGAPVPAKECTLSPISAIYSRIGASDDLQTARSTFAIEMQEIASALRASFNRPALILMDEVGRGTSPAEGESIAASVLRRLCQEHRASLSIFTTHYYTLVPVFARLPAVKVSRMHQFELVDYGNAALESSSAFTVAASHGVPRSILDRAQILRRMDYADDASSSAVASDALRDSTWLRLQAVKTSPNGDNDLAVELLTRCLSHM